MNIYIHPLSGKGHSFHMEHPLTTCKQRTHNKLLGFMCIVQIWLIIKHIIISHYKHDKSNVITVMCYFLLQCSNTISVMCITVHFNLKWRVYIFLIIHQHRETLQQRKKWGTVHLPDGLPLFLVQDKNVFVKCILCVTLKEPSTLQNSTSVILT